MAVNFFAFFSLTMVRRYLQLLFSGRTEPPANTKLDGNADPLLASRHGSTLPPHGFVDLARTPLDRDATDTKNAHYLCGS